jgi:AbrB family looped-hinge helix DNA binding protein
LSLKRFAGYGRGQLTSSITLRMTRERLIGLSGYDFPRDLVTVSPKSQVVIPKRVREKFGLSPGQQFQVIALPGRIELVPSQPPAALRGFLNSDNNFERESDRL